MEYLSLNKGVDRRVFIKGIGFVSLSLLLGTTLGGCECLIQSINNRPMRRRLRIGSPEVDADIATYRDAVALMKGLPASDPRSWSAQAAIHGTAGVGFNFCHHGTNHFFSWHRAYLLYFEQICQELTGRKDFGLPYWNWNQNPDLNPAFTDPASPLFEARTRTTATGNPSISSAALTPMFSDTNFFTFSSQIEGSPHNTMHGWVGGIMGGFGSAGDPVFWTHHCMVDYCWAKWNLELGNDNTNDPTWTSTSWDHFVDRNGQPISSVTAGITTLMPLLSYQYESSAIGDVPAEDVPSGGAEFESLKQRIEKGADVRYVIKRRILIAEAAEVAIEKPFSREIRVSAADFSTLIESEAARESVFASIEYAELPPASDFFVRVFVNMPAANEQTPIEDPHYAGSFAFFGTKVDGGGGHAQEPRFLVNVTNTLRELRRRQALSADGPISIQLVPVPMSARFERRDAMLRLRKVELVVTPVTVRSTGR